jgi:hypothetical protein
VHLVLCTKIVELSSFLRCNHAMVTAVTIADAVFTS